ncbi:MAG TPA: NAD(P)H-dependent glycerol-3-phosphate dehydrogenase [Bryobacteraceae bacterium]|nr:NAD(P)H-dependent glycerol-3-phosphate dehydrogenase [Bryobacteraceae bacterium]
MKTLAIVGGGSWGTALAIVLAPRCDRVRLWVKEEDLAARMAESRVNDVFLNGFVLPESVAVSSRLEEVVPGAGIVLGVMPSKFARTVYSEMRTMVAPGTPVVSATKGLEPHSLLRMSEVAASVLGGAVAVLSGPTFAREVAAGVPTAVVISVEDPALAKSIQTSLSGPTFRLYTNSDPTGVEIAAALKNVIAIAAGVCHGLGLGHNAIAALITRGLAELRRLACAMGGHPHTLAGLAGLGDLVLTCTGELSRNRSVGVELAKGRNLADIVGSMKMVAEGVDTTAVAMELAARHSIELPITAQIDAILRGERSPRDAIRELMERSLKDE